eukprot:5381393-Pleurochrysis_carterae.AAC.1
MRGRGVGGGRAQVPRVCVGREAASLGVPSRRSPPAPTLSRPVPSCIAAQSASQHAAGTFAIRAYASLPLRLRDDRAQVPGVAEPIRVAVCLHLRHGHRLLLRRQPPRPS